MHLCTVQLHRLTFELMLFMSERGEKYVRNMSPTSQNNKRVKIGKIITSKVKVHNQLVFNKSQNYTYHDVGLESIGSCI